MSNVTPSRAKALIASPDSPFCDKFVASLVGQAQLDYDIVTFLFADNGDLSDEFKTLICSLGCAGTGTGGGGTPNPDMPAPIILASDGTYSDKVQVSWSAVVASDTIGDVTAYYVYRAPQEVTSPTLATKIATVSAPTLFYDDTSAVPGTIYNYWVKATNGSEESAFSLINAGNAGTVTTSLTAVSDLACTQGFYENSDGVISLVWTPSAGATKWDIYRNTVNDPDTATLIDPNRVPASTGGIGTFSPGVNGFFDNDGELVYFDDPPVGSTIYYYWVVAKKDSPPAVSDKSNVGSGWIYTAQAPWINGTLRLERNQEFEIIEGGWASIRVVLIGSGGGGAGGGVLYGGGGGGGPAVIIGELPVVLGSKVRLVVVPDQDNTAAAADQTNGDPGPVTKLQYSAFGDWTDTVDVMTCAAPDGGVYSSSGSGAGGAAGSGSTSGVTSPSIIAGRNGGAASGPTGGKSGYRFGSRRLAPSHYNGFNLLSYVGNGGEGSPGSGSSGTGDPSTVDLAVGGTGATGYAIIAY